MVAYSTRGRRDSKVCVQKHCSANWASFFASVGLLTVSSQGGTRKYASSRYASVCRNVTWPDLTSTWQGEGLSA